MGQGSASKEGRLHSIFHDPEKAKVMAQLPAEENGQTRQAEQIEQSQRTEQSEQAEQSSETTQEKLVAKEVTDTTVAKGLCPDCEVKKHAQFDAETFRENFARIQRVPIENLPDLSAPASTQTGLVIRDQAVPGLNAVQDNQALVLEHEALPPSQRAAAEHTERPWAAGDEELQRMIQESVNMAEEAVKRRAEEAEQHRRIEEFIQESARMAEEDEQRRQQQNAQAGDEEESLIRQALEESLELEEERQNKLNKPKVFYRQRLVFACGHHKDLGFTDIEYDEGSYGPPWFDEERPYECNACEIANNIPVTQAFGPAAPRDFNPPVEEVYAGKGKGKSTAYLTTAQPVAPPQPIPSVKQPVVPPVQPLAPQIHVQSPTPETPAGGEEEDLMEGFDHSGPQDGHHEPGADSPPVTPAIAHQQGPEEDDRRQALWECARLSGYGTVTNFGTLAGYGTTMNLSEINKRGEATGRIKQMPGLREEDEGEGEHEAHERRD